MLTMGSRDMFLVAAPIDEFADPGVAATPHVLEERSLLAPAPAAKKVASANSTTRAMFGLTA